jgi:hypothetical protein
LDVVFQEQPDQVRTEVWELLAHVPRDFIGGDWPIAPAL